VRYGGWAGVEDRDGYVIRLFDHRSVAKREATWDFGPLRAGRQGVTPAPSVHSIQAQNAANGILLSDCWKERESLREGRSLRSGRQEGEARGGGIGWRANRGNLTPFPRGKGNNRVRVDSSLSLQNPHLPRRHPLP
jgi:hypothetical protein